MKALVGRKLGMTQIFAEDGSMTPVTVVQAGPCVVTQIRTADRDGYTAVQLGFGEVKAQRVNKPESGHLAKAGADPLRHLTEFRTEAAPDVEVGATLTVEQFAAGDHVDVTATSKGKGFQGVMKRHGFHGLRASHGVERKHRSAGSVGAGTTPGRVFKGKKMPGRMGGERTTILSLQVVETDPGRNLLLIKGAVPGPKGGIVTIRAAVKRTVKG